MNYRELLEHFTTIGTFNGVEISKSFHCSEPRQGTNIPRDANMSKTKYVNIIQMALDKGLDISQESFITWKTDRYNGMILTKPKSNKIKIKTVMLKQKTKVLQKTKNIDITNEYNNMY